MKKTRKSLAMFLCLMVITSFGTVNLTANAKVVEPQIIWLNEQYLLDTHSFSFSEELALVRNQERYGFIDKSGKEVIPLKYEDAEPFNEGLAAVKVNGYWGFIDKTGKEVITPQYNGVGSFSEGLAGVRIYGYSRWGYIDKTGDVIIPTEYDYGFPFKEGVAIVVKIIYPKTTSISAELPDRKVGLIDKTGREIVPLKYDDIEFFSEGLARVELNGLYGFIDISGREVIAPKYKYAESFSEGLAMVFNGENYGFIDKSGKEIISLPPKYEAEYYGRGSFSEGLAAIRSIDYKYGYIDRTGKIVLPLKYDMVNPFSEGLAPVQVAWNRWEYIDKKGNTITSSKYTNAGTFKDGIALIKQEGKWGLIKNPLTFYAKAVPSPSKVIVNGNAIAFDAYFINGNNYFKLRDIATVFSGSERQFDVTWDDTKKAINLISNQGYRATELLKGDGLEKIAILNTSKILKDGKEISLTAYTIDGSNYFKLRDIASAFNIGLLWDGASNTISIDTSKNYK